MVIPNPTRRSFEFAQVFSIVCFRLQQLQYELNPNHDVLLETPKGNYTPTLAESVDSLLLALPPWIAPHNLRHALPGPSDGRPFGHGPTIKVNSADLQANVRQGHVAAQGRVQGILASDNFRDYSPPTTNTTLFVGGLPLATGGIRCTSVPRGGPTACPIPPHLQQEIHPDFDGKRLDREKCRPLRRGHIAVEVA